MKWEGKKRREKLGMRGKGEKTSEKRMANKSPGALT